jgi:methionine-S-sulfoxide reductase
MTTERAILAGGCFWGMQDLIRRYKGVISTRVGYSGGDVPNATYRNHGTHAEAIEIEFDPSKISYREILEFFFQIHDPSTRNRQGNDLGASYRSAIFYTSEEQNGSRWTRSPMLMRRDCGPARSSPRSHRPAISGRPSPSTRIISSGSPTDIRAISCGPTGNCRIARRPCRKRPDGTPSRRLK